MYLERCCVSVDISSLRCVSFYKQKYKAYSHSNNNFMNSIL